MYYYLYFGNRQRYHFIDLLHLKLWTVFCDTVLDSGILQALNDYSDIKEYFDRHWFPGIKVKTAKTQKMS